MKLGLTMKVLVFYVHHFMCGHHKCGLGKSYEMGHFGHSNAVPGGRDVLVASPTAGSRLPLRPGALPTASQTEEPSDDVLLTDVCVRELPSTSLHSSNQIWAPNLTTGDRQPVGTSD